MDQDAEHRDHILTTFREEGGGYTYMLHVDDEGPSYCATYGWSVNFDLPELIGFGTQSIAMQQVPEIFDALIDVMEPGSVIEDNQAWPVLGDGRACIGRFVHPSNIADRWFAEALACRAVSGRTDPMRAYQIFWPDEAGRFPWEDGCAAVSHSLQPLLFERLA